MSSKFNKFFTPKDTFDAHSLGVHICIVQIWLIELIYLSNVFTPIHSVSMTWLFESKSMVWFLYHICSYWYPIFVWKILKIKNSLYFFVYRDTPIFLVWFILLICLFGDIIKRGRKNYLIMGDIWKFEFAHKLVYMFISFQTRYATWYFALSHVYRYYMDYHWIAHAHPDEKRVEIPEELKSKRWNLIQLYLSSFGFMEG